MGRRLLITRLIGAGLALSVFATTGAGWARSNPPGFPDGSFGIRTSPVAAPAGPHPVGRVDTELDDGSRAVMVSAWYPASQPGLPAPYVPSTGPLNQFRIAARGAEWLHTPAAALTIAAAQVPATENARLDGDHLPVVVMSPGMGTPRWILSGLAEDLASRGWVVVVMDHTGESPAIQFSDGRVVLGDAPAMTDGYMRQRLSARVADAELILDRLAELPVVGPHLDLDRIAMAGHSYGGLTAVQTMASDPRVRAAVVLDGSAGWDGVATAPALDRPVLLLESGDMLHASWLQVHGQLDIASIRGAGHYTATDLPSFGCDVQLCGTVPPDRAAAVSRGVVAAWLAQHVLDSDTPEYTAPEVLWRQ